MKNTGGSEPQNLDCRWEYTLDDITKDNTMADDTSVSLYLGWDFHY